MSDSQPGDRYGLPKDVGVLLRAMAIAEGCSVSEVIKRAVQDRFKSKWPFNTKAQK